MSSLLIDRQGFNFYKSYYDVYKEMNPSFSIFGKRKLIALSF